MATTGEKRDVSLKHAVAGIQKKYGETVLMRVGDEKSRADVDVVPTGCLSLDAGLGVGGIPRGRIVEIFGPEASGKTTLALHLIGTLGVDVDELWVSQPDSGEQALDIVEQLVRSNAVDVVVVDSVAALVPRAELEGEMGDSHIGLQARLMSQALRKLTGVISRTKSIVVFINQIRMKIGVMFGNPETTPGGNALKFYASVRLDIRRIATIKEGDTPVGNRVRVKVVKNKVAPPFRQAEFDIVYGEGISALGDLLDLGVARKIAEKSGTWYSYDDERLGQGRVNAIKFLKENPKLARELEAAVRADIGVRSPEGPPPAEEAPAEAE
jgi:recombination protein RecA